MDGTVKIVEKIAPSLKDRGLILVLRKLVVDVLKLHRLGVVVVFDAADSVRVHPFKRDAVLRGHFFWIVPLCPDDCRLDPFFIFAGKL